LARFLTQYSRHILSTWSLSVRAWNNVPKVPDHGDRQSWLSLLFQVGIWKPCFSADHKQFLADYLVIGDQLLFEALVCWKIELVQDAMDPSQANEIRPIFGISFCLQSPNVWGGGGDYGKGGVFKGQVWLMMKNQTPGSFFSCQCCVQEWGFLQAEIFNFNHMSQKIYQWRFLQYVRNNFLMYLHHDQAKSFNLSSLQPFAYSLLVSYKCRNRPFTLAL
jgi:hypothetical protein